MELKAIFLNCTLKRSPKVSNTQALVDIVIGLMEPLGVTAEVVRVIDHDVAFGVSVDEGSGDGWPGIYEKIKQADIIVVATPIWFGVRGSVAQMIIERLDGSYAEGDPENGQWPLYGKVAGVIVTGNEDGAHDAAATTLFNLSHLGCTIPPNSDCYWVGDAGPGPSFIEAGGDKHMYTNKTARFLAHNTVHAAKLMRQQPYGTNIRDLTEEARLASTDVCRVRHGE